MRIALADGLQELRGQRLGGDFAAREEIGQFGGGAFNHGCNPSEWGRISAEYISRGADATPLRLSLIQHGRHAVEIAAALRGIGQGVVDGQGGRRLVVAEDVLHGQRVGQRLDAVGVDLLAADRRSRRWRSSWRVIVSSSASLSSSRARCATH